MEKWLFKRQCKNFEPEDKYFGMPNCKIQIKIDRDNLLLEVEDSDKHYIFTKFNDIIMCLKDPSIKLDLDQIPSISFIICNNHFLKHISLPEYKNCHYITSSIKNFWSVVEQIEFYGTRDEPLELIKLYLVLKKVSRKFSKKYLYKIFNITKFSSLEERIKSLQFCKYSEYHSIVQKLLVITNHTKDEIETNLSLFFFPAKIDELKVQSIQLKRQEIKK